MKYLSILFVLTLSACSGSNSSPKPAGPSVPDMSKAHKSAECPWLDGTFSHTDREGKETVMVIHLDVTGTMSISVDGTQPLKVNGKSQSLGGNPIVLWCEQSAIMFNGVLQNQSVTGSFRKTDGGFLISYNSQGRSWFDIYTRKQ